MPFKRIVSREDGEPWGDTGMSSLTWLSVPPANVVIADLIATQPGVLLHALARDYDETPIGGDVYPHVILWDGELYLEDGHHRVVRRLLRGKKKVMARVIESTALN